jgi:hypothetical protein
VGGVATALAKELGEILVKRRKLELEYIFVGATAKL